MIEIDEIIELSKVLALFETMQDSYEKEPYDGFKFTLKKVQTLINKKHQLLQCKYHAMQYEIEKLKEENDRLNETVTCLREENKKPHAERLVVESHSDTHFCDAFKYTTGVDFNNAPKS